MFICGYCGKEYDTPKERNACEAACCAEKEREKKEASQKEMHSKAVEIHNKISQYKDLENSINNDIEEYYKEYKVMPPHSDGFGFTPFDWLCNLFL